MTAPVRLCCGERHEGVVCSDGRVMCCLCFTRVTQDELARYDSGLKMDVCQECWDAEQPRLKER